MHFFISYSFSAPLCFMLMGNPFWFSLISLRNKAHGWESLISLLNCHIVLFVWWWNVSESIKETKALVAKPENKIPRNDTHFHQVMGCWYVARAERRERWERKKNWGFSVSAFWHWENHVCAGTNTSTPHSNDTHQEGKKKRPVSVLAKMEKSTGCVGSRARLMGVLGIEGCFTARIKLGPTD